MTSDNITNTNLKPTTREASAVWLHIQIAGSEDSDLLKEYAPFLDSSSVAALCADDTRPRVEDFGDDHLIILRAVNMNPGEEPDDMISLRIWSDGNNVVSVVRRKVSAVSKLISMFTKKSESIDANELIVKILTNVVENMSEPLANFFDMIDCMELDFVDDKHEVRQQTLKSLRYSVLAFRRYIAPMRTAITELEDIVEEWSNPDLLRQVLQAKDNITRHLEDIDVARERLQYQQEEILAAVTDRVNRNMYRLSIVAAIFLPLGFLTGLLGINVAGIPAAEAPSAFWWVVGGCVAIVIGQLAYYKRDGWF